MADTSSYSIEERLVASVWVHERQHTGQTVSQVTAALRERFNKDPPRRATLLDWEKRAFALGSVKERPRSGRKTTRLEKCSGGLENVRSKHHAQKQRRVRVPHRAAATRHPGILCLSAEV